MRKKNSISEFSRERNEFLLQNFREAIAAQSEIDKNKAFHTVADTPAPRFWVSETRAAEVVSKLISGSDPTPAMIPEKREMFLEIYRRYRRLRSRRSADSVSAIVFDVVNDEAPRSYLSWQTVRSIVYRELLTRRKRLQRNPEL